MVRRRISDAVQTLPSWVTDFDQDRYPSESFGLSWRRWHEDVKGYCDQENVLTENFSLWLHLMSNVYQVKNEHWRSHRADDSRTSALVTNLLADLDEVEQP